MKFCDRVLGCLFAAFAGSATAQDVMPQHLSQGHNWTEPIPLSARKTCTLDCFALRLSDPVPHAFEIPQDLEGSLAHGLLAAFRAYPLGPSLLVGRT